MNVYIQAQVVQGYSDACECIEQHTRDIASLLSLEGELYLFKISDMVMSEETYIV